MGEMEPADREVAILNRALLDGLRTEAGRSVVAAGPDSLRRCVIDYLEHLVNLDGWSWPAGVATGDSGEAPLLVYRNVPVYASDFARGVDIRLVLRGRLNGNRD